MIITRLLGCFTALIGGLAMAQTTPYILQTSPQDAAALSARYGLTVAQTVSVSPSIYIVNVPGAPPSPQLVAQIAGTSGVVEFEPNSILESSETDGDEKIEAAISQLSAALADSTPVNYYGTTVRSAYLNQPASSLIETAQAQSYATGGGVVAVIDTGVDPYHPALANSLIPGYDFTRNQPGIPSEWNDLNAQQQTTLSQSGTVPMNQKTLGATLNQSTVAILDQSTVAIFDGNSLPSDFGHGTMTAGLIHLVAPTALIMPLKAFHADGTGNLSDIISAIYYGVNNGAQVISMSFSTTTLSPDLANAISYANAHGVICVASAGNDGQQLLVYPAGLPDVVGVGSTNNQNVRSSFSNFGTASAFMGAPGEALITTYPGNNYAGVWGTSFSSALVAGAAALMTQMKPGAGYSTAVDAFENGFPIDGQLLGDVRLDALLTIQYVSQHAN